ncbi:MAG TPA: protease complex subunit PrcB family protein [Ignavibacteria bacterium]|jgi:hypothetical protein
MLTDLKAVFVIGMFFFLSCNSSNKTGNENINFDSIAHGSYSSIEDKRQVVLRTENEYQKIWDEFYKDLDQMPRIPDVDLKKNTVIAVFMGTKPTGGYDIEIDKVMSVGGKIQVDVIEISPGAKCVTTDAITRPYEFIKIPKTDKEVEFKIKSITKDCN